MPSVYLAMDYPDQRSTDNVKGAAKALLRANRCLLGMNYSVGVFLMSGLKCLVHAKTGP